MEEVLAALQMQDAQIKGYDGKIASLEIDLKVQGDSLRESLKFEYRNELDK